MPELFVTEITSVGAVDAGDNPEAHITFYKRKQSADSAETREPIVADKLDLSALDDDLRTQVQKHLDEADAKVADLEQKVEELTPPPSEEDVEKAASPEVQELLAKQKAETAELRKRLDAEIAQRRAEDFAKRATVLRPLLGGKADDVAATLNTLEAADPDAYAKLEKQLHAAAALVAESNVFKELGGDGDDAAPNTLRDAYVEKRLADGDKRTAAELRAAFWQTSEGRRATVAKRQEAK